jgi:tetratricopeptide (TPR) repeat protein
MIDSKSDRREAEAAGKKSRWMQRAILASICALVIGVYAYTARPAFVTSSSLGAADEYYNLLVRGFRAGQLNVKTTVPPGLVELPDPYDPRANVPYRSLDMSYYKGKFYLYHGVTPALVLFWPYVALAGRHLHQKDAALVFCLVGFLASAGLLCALRRRYFAEVSTWVVAAGTLAVGLATLMPSLLARCDIYEVAISCGYALTMVALATIWKALTEPERQGRWLAAASLAYGLAVGARPNLVFGAVVLLVPVARAWRQGRRMWLLLAAATIPIMLIGLGLMLYNALRFDSPIDFGMRYILGGDPIMTCRPFSARYLWFNFRAYFLEPARWSGRFPFVHDIRVPPLPMGHGRVEHPFGLLTNIPLVWLALAVPLAWPGRSDQVRSVLHWFATVVALLFGVCALPVWLFFSTCDRYEVDFLPALEVLAVTGILSLERALAGRLVWRRAARWGWSLLLGFSVASSLLASLMRCAEAHNNLGIVWVQAGQVQEAVRQYEQTLRIRPDYPEAHYDLGVALEKMGRTQEAIQQYGYALQIKPDYAEAHYNLAVALNRAGRMQEAIGHYEQAVRIKSDFVEAHNNLGLALMEQGRLPEAIGHYEQALRIDPQNASAEYNLGNALFELGKLPEAIEHWRQALRLNPDHAKAHYNLGGALEKLGRTQEAIQHYEQALRIKPDLAQAQNALARARAAQ